MEAFGDGSCYDEAAAVRTYIRDGKVDESVPWHDTLFDVSDAVKVVVDAGNQFKVLVEFAFSCCARSNLYRFKYHERFTESGDPVGGIGCRTEDELQHPRFYDFANKLINHYNHLTKASKLKLVRLHRQNETWGWSMLWCTYIIFTADDDSGKRAMYQAAIADPLNKRNDDRIYLGLLRNVDDDKVLAILSLTGSEEVTSPLLVRHAEEMARKPDGWRTRCPWMWARTT